MPIHGEIRHLVANGGLAVKTGIAPERARTCADGVWDGLTETYVRVYTDAPVTRGEIVPVRLMHIYKDGVWGMPI